MGRHGSADVLRLVCESRNPLALTLRDNIVAAASFVDDARAMIPQFQDLGVHAREAGSLLTNSVWLPSIRPLLGWCPYRDADDARMMCSTQAELQGVRQARDCNALRRAFHDGQRQFHPDHLRIKHPACSSQILEACSIALNAAMEARRAELSCPAR